MNWKGLLILMICITMLLPCFSGCDAGQDLGTTAAPTDTTTQPTHATEETDAPTEARYPLIQGDTIHMYYDDRLPVADIDCSGATVEITEQIVSSKVVGTDDSDSAVIYYRPETEELIAVGTGTAVVTVNGKTYYITVDSAPISLVMITGHSIGAGKTGVEAQSVLCAAGQAYSSYGTDIAVGETAGVGIGFSAEKSPVDICGFTSEGEGVIGEGGGLAYGWNMLTGEKIWVLNAAVGGTCLKQWTRGASMYQNSVKLFRYAQRILANEIAAGHYRLKNMAIIYHSAANFSYNKVSYTNELAQQWYGLMWDGYKEELSFDMDGDGEKETVQAMGFVPIWTNHSIHDDKAANYFMGASDTYEDMFMASLAGKSWLSDADLKKNFPEIDYETHGESVVKPTEALAVYSDGVHYIQAAYNALGMDIAQNLFAYLRTANRPESLTLVQPDGNKLYDEVDLRVGRQIEVLPMVEPLTVNDLTFTLSDNLSISYPCIITAEESGIGTLTISHAGTVLKTITFNIEE